MIIDPGVVEELADEAGIDPDSDVRTSYSGRHMYGRSCLGIVCSLGDLVRFAIAVRDLAERDSNFTYEWVDGVRQDDMGRSTIYYWPNVEVAP